MSTPSPRFARIARVALFVCLLAGLVGWAAEKQEQKQEENSAFSRTTVDIGIVVSDIEKAVEFYTEGLGFTEAEGFDVPAELGQDSGLSENQPFHVHVMVLGDDETATRVKLMQFQQAPGKRIDNSYIHSSYGMSYLTIFVNDITAAVERAAKQGAKPLAEGPVALPEGFPEGIFLAVVRDPDGNMIELVGPKP